MGHTPMPPSALGTHPVAPEKIAYLYPLVLDFYGHQMRAIDRRDFSTFVGTLTPDAEMSHPDGKADVGREAILSRLRQSSDRFAGLTVCHWFDKLTVDDVTDDTVRTSYYAMVSETTEDGVTRFRPPFLVHDVLRYGDGDELQTAVRKITLHNAGTTA